MKVSIVVPYYNASATIERALASVSGDLPFDCEVILVDDGSTVSPFRDLNYNWQGKSTFTALHLDQNVGKSRACNFAFEETTGDAVIVLDADDEMTPDWGEKMLRLMENWPPDSLFAGAWAVTQDGQPTGSGSGTYSRLQFLKGESCGEYLPIFRGNAAREIGYQTPGCRKICGILSYARLLEEGGLYIHPEVMRIYHTDTEGSITKHPFEPSKALDSYICFHAAREAIERFDRINNIDNSAYIGYLYFREAVYQVFGKSRLSGICFSFKNTCKLGLMRTALVLALSLMPRIVVIWLLSLCKSLGLVRSYG